MRRISAGSPHTIFSPGPVSDHVKTPTGFHQGLFKSLSQGPVLYKIMQRLLTAFHYKIFAQGLVKDLEQDLHARTHKIVIKGPAAAAAAAAGFVRS